MSIEYCHKHHSKYDTDFEIECLKCVNEEVEQENNEKKNQSTEKGDKVKIKHH